MIRIFVVDDHPVVREGMIAIVENQPDFKVVGSAGNAQDTIQLAEEINPDIILLDLELPGMSGDVAVPHILKASPKSRIIIFSGQEAGDRVLEAIRAGAKGYLLKGSSIDEITRAIHTVHGGGSYLEPSLAMRVIAEAGSPRPSAEQLSERELEVLRHVADGMPNKQIAGVMGISERTVRFHLSTIFNKLEVDNRAQAVGVAVQQGMI